MSKPFIRPSRREDIPQIEKLLSSEWLPPLMVAEFLETFWSLADGAGVLGCAGLEVYGEAGLIRSVVVHESLRGKGFGDLLAETAIDEAKRRGVQRLYLFTGDRMPFWARFGFEQCTLEDWEPAARASWQWQGISGNEEVAAYVKPMRTTIDRASLPPRT